MGDLGARLGLHSQIHTVSMFCNHGPRDSNQLRKGILPYANFYLEFPQESETDPTDFKWEGREQPYATPLGVGLAR